MQYNLLPLPLKTRLIPKHNVKELAPSAAILQISAIENQNSLILVIYSTSGPNIPRVEAKKKRSKDAISFNIVLCIFSKYLFHLVTSISNLVFTNQFPILSDIFNFMQKPFTRLSVNPKLHQLFCLYLKTCGVIVRACP